VHEEDKQGRRRISLELPNHVVDWIDRFRGEWGLRSRGDIVERLLSEVFLEPDAAQLPAGISTDQGVKRSAPAVDSRPSPDGLNRPAVGEGLATNGTSQLALRTDQALDPPSGQDHDSTGTAADPSDPFDEGGALVLVMDRADGELGVDFEAPTAQARPASRGSGGIDLPGFVRRQSDQLKRSLSNMPSAERLVSEPLPAVDATSLATALDCAASHWLQLYGTPPNATVLEAAMTWLALEIWPHVDQSEGRPFTWTLASAITAELAPSWSAGAASFERVMVMAGLLEDPFSTNTLSLRIPTLMRRFVHRFRKRQRGTSFQTLEHTMSLHGALKLLNLPTSPGHRLTLGSIREAYRDMALMHHPDSGGSAEQMRQLNEAYQLLKELYRTPG